MATIPTQIRIDEGTKKQALRKGIPFDIKYPEFKPEVIEAMEEAKRISRDPNVKHYTDVKEMFKEILEDTTEN